MSNQEAGSFRDATSYEPLTDSDRAMIKRLLSNWREVPSSWKEASADWYALNLPNLPISQFMGYERFVANKGTTFPNIPVDGQPFVYVVDAANGITWTLRYDKDIGDSYKWAFEGGGSLSANVNANESTASTGFTDLGTVGPTVTVPLAGVYEISFGSCVENSTLDSDTRVGVKYSAGTPTNGESIEAEGVVVGGSAVRIAQSRTILATITAASTVVKLQYMVGSGTGSFRNRWLIVKPQRLSS